MAQDIKAYIRCPQCNGTGEQYAGGGIGATGPFDCLWPECVDGYIEWGSLRIDPGLDDILDKCNDILDKCNDIKASIDEL